MANSQPVRARQLLVVGSVRTQMVVSAGSSGPTDVELVRQGLRLATRRAGNGVLPRFRDEQLRRLVDVMRTAEFDAGQVVVGQGKRRGSFFVLKAGRMTVEVDGRETASILPGMSFGEEHVALGVPQPATVVAAEACTALELQKTDYLAEVERMEQDEQAEGRAPRQSGGWRERRKQRPADAFSAEAEADAAALLAREQRRKREAGMQKQAALYRPPSELALELSPGAEEQADAAGASRWKVAPLDTPKKTGGDSPPVSPMDEPGTPAAGKVQGLDLTLAEQEPDPIIARVEPSFEAVRSPTVRSVTKLRRYVESAAGKTALRDERRAAWSDEEETEANSDEQDGSYKWPLCGKMRCTHCTKVLEAALLGTPLPSSSVCPWRCAPFTI